MIPKLVVSGLLLLQYFSHQGSSQKLLNAAVGKATKVPDYSNDKAGFKRVYTSITCEHNTTHLTCPGGTTVKVIRANYGRTVSIKDVCVFDPSATVDKTDCVSNQFTLLSKHCNHRYTCATLVNNERMKVDPCAGTHKYLNVTYACESNGLTVAASCAENMTLYVDGSQKRFSSYWRHPSYVDIPPDVTVIGIECVSTSVNDSQEAFSGIVATFSNGDVTSPSKWKCSDTYKAGWSGIDFDASDWSSAVLVKNDSRIKKMRPLPGGMSHDANWIWYNDVVSYVRATHVYCRTEIKQADFCKLFDPEVDSPIKVLLSVDPVLTRVFKSACTYEATRLSAKQVKDRVAELADLFAQTAERSKIAADKMAKIAKTASELENDKTLWGKLKKARNKFIKHVRAKVKEYKQKQAEDELDEEEEI